MTSRLALWATVAAIVAGTTAGASAQTYEIAKLVPGYGGVTCARLERHGVHAPVTSYIDTGTPLLSPTADGAAKLTPRLVPAGSLS